MASSNPGNYHAGASDAPVPKKMFDILYAFGVSYSTFTACELGIFDVLQDAGAPQSANKIAEQLSTNPDATGRLLDVLVSLELLVKEKCASDEAVYSNSPLASFLTTSSQSYFLAYVKNVMNMGKPLMNNLTSAVREGGNQWQRTFNIPSSEVFKNIFRNKESVLNFMEAMRGCVRPAAKGFLTAFDLSRFQTMCDLGGGPGDIAYAACMAYPNMKITVLDLPQVVENSPYFRPPMDECPNQQNVTFVGGDFFEPALPAADLYVLTHILQDWSEDKIDVLLSNAFKNLLSGGGILIGELLLFDDHPGPLTTQLRSLVMLTISGGRDRSGLEYKQLLEKHGFKDVQVKNTHTNSLDAVLAIKP